VRGALVPLAFALTAAGLYIAYTIAQLASK